MHKTDPALLKAITFALMVWALCAYGMYSYRKVVMENKAESWKGSGKIEIEGEPAVFEVMFMNVPSEAASFGRMFLTWKGKTYDIIDDTAYAGDLVAGEEHAYLHWQMPAEIRASIPALWASLPKGEGSHFMVERADGSFARSVYIQWQQLGDAEWFDSFDRQLAMAED